MSFRCAVADSKKPWHAGCFGFNEAGAGFGAFNSPPGHAAEIFHEALIEKHKALTAERAKGPEIAKKATARRPIREAPRLDRSASGTRLQIDWPSRFAPKKRAFLRKIWPQEYANFGISQPSKSPDTVPSPNVSARNLHASDRHLHAHDSHLRAQREDAYPPFLVAKYPQQQGICIVTLRRGGRFAV